MKKVVKTRGNSMGALKNINADKGFLNHRLTWGILTMRQIIVIAAMGWLAAVGFGAAPATQAARETSSFHKTISKSIGYEYVVQFPRDYAEKKKHPLIIYLHGSGSCGGETSKLSAATIFKVASERDDF